MPDISVIIPSYKPGEYINENFRSLANQTLDKSQFEVIIVLNGCGQPWLHQITSSVELILKDNNVRLIHIEEGGVSNARNIAIDNASGEYITFIDDDDYVSPEYLECLLKAAEPTVVSVSDSVAFHDGTNSIIQTYTPHVTYQKNVGRSNVNMLQARAIFNGPWMKLIHKNCIQESRFDTGFSIGEDSLFMFEISKNIKNVRLAPPEAIYYRRYREGSAVMTKHKASYWLNNGLRCSGKYCKIYFRNPFSYDLRLFVRVMLSNIKGTILHIISK